MSNTSSNLDNYIQLLLSDDTALNQFLKNPLASETTHGLTKAERSVLRRVVQHLPATSKNGFSSARTLSSFRRSLRLLQNVIHNTASKMHSKVLQANSDVAASSHTTGSQNGGTFQLIVYYPNGGSEDFTCKTNTDVDDNGGPYANAHHFQIVFGSGATSVGRLLLGASQAFPNTISYSTVPGSAGNYVSEITINGNDIKADLSNQCYTQAGADFVFWFYSVNGTPNHGGVYGTQGTSFENYPLNDGDTVYWQLIAPDKQYGFQPCM